MRFLLSMLGYDMTPTEQDKELREKLLNLRITVWKQTNLNGQANLDHDSVNEILQLITADRKRVALEARIDENRACQGIVGSVWSTSGMLNGMEKRTLEFRQELEKL